ncbi:MAG: rhodanese-like domain-containing protein [Terracidiphilus sp.]|nr:rhodanese-like domain-containing protein [Terracidiphilus sp.]
MNWIPLLFLTGVVLVLALLKKTALVSTKEAQELLKSGALVIDVRTAGEYVSGHLEQAVNMPLNEIGASIDSLVESKDRVLLLHCRSGVRSGAAVKKLKTMGYTNVYNLGSYARAESIVNGKKHPPETETMSF